MDDDSSAHGAQSVFRCNDVPVAHVEEPDDRKTHRGDPSDGARWSAGGDAGAGRIGRNPGRHRASGEASGDTGWYGQSELGVRPGSLLVSATELTEPVFRRTVVYVIEHNRNGSLGVVLNRPSDTPVRQVLPQWSHLAARPGTLHVGGPVKRDAAMCLAMLRVGARIDRASGLRRVDGRIALVDLDCDPAFVAPYVECIRVFAGYAGWSYGQLDGELERQDWIVVSALPRDVVEPGGIDVWSRVLRRQPMPLALLSTHPIELERN
jgi:putative transcriptional regulator